MGNNSVVFDSSNKFFVKAKETNELIKTTINDFQADITDRSKEIKNLSTQSPVGYNYSKRLDYSTDLNNIISKWNIIMINANNVREIGDLLNKGFESELYKLFNGEYSLLEILREVAMGKQNLRTLLGNTLFSSIDYYEILLDGYTVQGYTEIQDKNGDKILITAHGKGNQNAKLYIYNKETGKLESVVIFDHHDHVGGITYDKEHDILWVASDNGKVHSYDYKALTEILEVQQKTNPNQKVQIDFNSRKYSNIEIPNNIEVRELLSDSQHQQDGMDSIYYYNGKLYSCSYGSEGELVATSVDVNRTREGITITNNSKIIGNLNGATQGIAVYEENGKTYAITASSAAFATSQSRLTKWEVTDEGLEPLGYKYVDHTGLEGIEIEDGYVKGVFERGWGIWDQNQSTEVLASTDGINDPANPTVDTLLSSGGGLWDFLNGNETEYIY